MVACGKQNIIPLVYTEEQHGQTAPEVQQRVERKLLRRAGGPHELVLQNDALTDVEATFCGGPFFSKDEVARELGTNTWLPMPRVFNYSQTAALLTQFLSSECRFPMFNCFDIFATTYDCDMTRIFVTETRCD